MMLVDAEPFTDGPRRGVRQVYAFGDSTLVQEITLLPGAARLEFRTHADWREPRVMLRALFPVTPQSDEAVFEIQFGHIRRPTHDNTSWDRARTEVAAHKWVDLSQGEYGVALLNDCKYGHKVKGGVMELALLRTPKYVGVPESAALFLPFEVKSIRITPD
jgi:alpha-mannosidase